MLIKLLHVSVVVKDPPYSVKETGYAGFNLPIDICFRTVDEPKKVRFNYDLDLQPAKVQRKTYVFRNPDEDLRRRLICGGGVCIFYYFVITYIGYFCLIVSFLEYPYVIYFVVFCLW